MSKTTAHLYNSVEELMAQFEPAIGKQFRELDVNHRIVGDGNKGVLGQVVEEGVFHYPINSDHNADFPNLGIELKTTGIWNRKKDISAKERLPLCAFNYEETSVKSFDDSYVWSKCKKLLIAVYEFVENISYGDMVLLKGFLHSFSEADLEVMKNDYKILQDKILNGKADKISETDTDYLSACTSGAGHGQLDKTATKALGLKVKPRKFALKTAYMTQVIRKMMSKAEVESIIKASELKEASIEDVITSRLTPFIGKSEDELLKLLPESTDCKNKFERYVAAMLGAKGKVNDLDEFQKANITLKTIRLEENGTIEQNMSFPAFSFIDIVQQKWEDSDFRDMMANQKFLFAIFEKVDGKYVFKRMKFWSLPEEILERDGQNVFNELKQVLMSGNIVRGFQTQKNGKVIRLNNFPKSSSNPYIHIRPHGQDGEDTNPLPVPDKLTGLTEYTKQCFWFKKSYIMEVIKE